LHIDYLLSACAGEFIVKNGPRGYFDCIYKAKEILKNLFPLQKAMED